MSASVTPAPAMRRLTFIQARTWPAVALLAPIILLAAVFRLHGIADAPLWGDEVATLRFSGLSWSDLFLGIGRLEPNPPAFYALEKLWIPIAGESALALRLPAALFGLAGVAAIWASCRAAFGLRAAHWAALLLAINPTHIELSRDARGYTLLFLLIVLAAHCGLRIATSQRPAWVAAPVMSLCAAAAMSVHYTGVVATACVFGAAGVMAVLAPDRRLHRIGALCLSGTLALALASPALFAMLSIAADKTNNASWIPAPDAFMATMFVISTWAAPYSALRSMPASSALALMAIGAIVIVAALAWCLAPARRTAPGLGLFAGLIASIALMVGISQASPILVERTFLFSLAFLLPLCGVALATLPVLPRIAMLAGLLVAHAPAYPRLADSPRHSEDWTGLAEAAQQATLATGWPIIVRSGMDAMTLDHFLPAADPARPALSITPRIGAALSQAAATQFASTQTLPADTSPDALCGALGHPGGVHLIVWRYSLPRPEHQLTIALLSGAGGHLGSSTEHGILILQSWPGVCAKPPPSPAP